jgi:hypothetical protein
VLAQEPAQGLGSGWGLGRALVQEQALGPAPGQVQGQAPGLAQVLGPARGLMCLPHTGQAMSWCNRPCVSASFTVLRLHPSIMTTCMGMCGVTVCYCCSSAGTCRGSSLGHKASLIEVAGPPGCTGGHAASGKLCSGAGRVVWREVES